MLSFCEQCRGTVYRESRLNASLSALPTWRTSYYVAVETWRISVDCEANMGLGNGDNLQWRDLKQEDGELITWEDDEYRGDATRYTFRY